jgi:hypothetical protein
MHFVGIHHMSQEFDAKRFLCDNSNSEKGSQIIEFLTIT